MYLDSKMMIAQASRIPLFSAIAYDSGLGGVASSERYLSFS